MKISRLGQQNSWSRISVFNYLLTDHLFIKYVAEKLFKELCIYHTDAQSSLGLNYLFNLFDHELLVRSN